MGIHAIVTKEDPLVLTPTPKNGIWSKMIERGSSKLVRELEVGLHGQL